MEPLFMSAFQSKHSYVVNKAAEVWNKLAKDEEGLECSDNLKSTLSSLQSKLDLVMPGANAAESGAQANPLGDPSFVALSSASSHGNLAESTPKATSKLPQRSSSRRRAAQAQKEVEAVVQVTKAATTPRRLRHENSQLRFAHIASSSPLADESQHLTERQREVRSRQRNNAGMYSGLVNSSPTKMEIDDAKPDVEDSQSGHYSTPKRGSSFNKVISLTPTPRRGQFLQMDDDPPSSPPLPRPDPLQSEIQLRSRGSSVVESWQFSSPPASPVVQQTVSRAQKSQHLRSKQDSSAEVQPTIEPAKQMLTRSRRHTIGTATEDELVIPSSIEVPEATVDESVRTSKRRKGQQPASSPLKPSEPAAETPIKRSAPELRRMRSNPGPVSNIAEQTELETAPSPNNARGRRAARRRQTMDSATTEPASIPPASPQLTAPAPTFTIELENVASLDTPELKRKRKRSARQSSRSRKRRSVGGLPSMPTEESIESADDDDAALPVVEEAKEVEAVATDNDQEARPDISKPTRQLSQRQRTRTRSRGRKSANIPSSPRKEDGDTDEEIFSQLTNESNAVSQIQVEEDAPMEDVKPPLQNLTPQAHTAPTESQVQVAEAPASILNVLERGLSQLRGATLSRDEVYKMEDMLMDMKRELYAAEQRGRGTDSVPPSEI